MVLPKDHEFLIAGKAMKIADAKAAVDKEWKKLKTISSLAVGQSKEQKGGYSGSTERQRESPLCNIDGHVSSQKCGVRTKFTKVQKDESCSEVIW